MDKLVTEYLREIEVAALSKHTIRAYDGALRRFLAWCAKPGQKIVRPNQITYDALVAYIAYLRRQHYATGSIDRMMSSVREWRKWLSIRGHAPPLYIMPKVGGKTRKLPVVLTPTEVLTLIATAKAETGSDGGDVEHVGIRDRAILEVLYSTGCRNAELCGMDKGDVDLHGEIIRVMGKGKKERIVPLGTPARRALKRYLEFTHRPIARPGHGRAVFLSRDGYRVGTKTVHRIVSGAGQAAGFKKPIGPHVLRHSMATHMVRAKAPIELVSKLLGHASVATTMIYVTLAASDIFDAFDRFHPRAGDSDHSRMD